MNSLVLNGDAPFERVYQNNAKEIYRYVVESIQNNLHIGSKEKIRVATIQLNDLEYHIDLPRENFVDALKKAATVFSENNEMEKAQECALLELKVLEVEAR